MQMNTNRGLVDTHCMCLISANWAESLGGMDCEEIHHAPADISNAHPKIII
jgi:hypothetical protein